MALLASARAIEATKVMNGENNQAKEVANRMPRSLYQNQTEGYAPPVKEMERTMKLVQELENPSTSFRYGPKETQGISREGTSQAAKETHQEGQDKGKEHLTSKEKQIATLQAAIEELKANHNPNPELIEYARKLPAESRMPSEQKSNEIERRELNVPRTPCLQWVPPLVGKGTLTDITLPGGVTGQGVLVDYEFNILNTCQDAINNVYFSIEESYNCPANCVSLTGRREGTTNGVPGTIEQGKISTGNQVWTDHCIQQDSSGAQTAVSPELIVATVYANGDQDGGPILSGPRDLTVYP